LQCHYFIKVNTLLCFQDYESSDSFMSTNEGSHPQVFKDLSLSSFNNKSKINFFQAIMNKIMFANWNMLYDRNEGICSFSHTTVSNTVFNDLFIPLSSLYRHESENTSCNFFWRQHQPSMKMIIALLQFSELHNMFVFMSSISF